MSKDTTRRWAVAPVKSGLLVSALLLTPLAQANTSGSADFDQLDQDGNGSLSQQEFQSAQIQTDYNEADSNADGQISRTEFAALENTSITVDSSSQQSMAESGSSSEYQTDSQSGSQSSSAQSSSDSGSSQTAATSSSQSSSDPSSQQQSSGQGSQALQELAKQEDQLSEFVKAVEASGMADSLTSGTQYTIFAPTNDALESSEHNLQQLIESGDQEQLVNVLRAHIVADDVDPDMAKQISKAKTIGGGEVALSSEGDTLKVGEAKVVKSDIQQGNLRIYAIDGVLEEGATLAANTSDSSQQQSSSQSETASASQSDTESSWSGEQQATAQTGGATGGATSGSSVDAGQFDELDENGDGYLSEDELQAKQDLAAQQDQLDSDSDGRVSRTEFAAFEQQSGMQSESAEDPTASDMPPHHEGAEEWDPSSDQ